VAESLYWLGSDCWEQGRVGEAERLIREALAIRRETLGNESEEVAHTLNLLALVLVDRTMWTEAEAATREGMAIKVKLTGRKHLNVVKSLNMLGHVLVSQGKYSEAEETVREALDLYHSLATEEVFPLTHMLSCLGQAIAGQGRFGEAETVYREMLEAQRKFLGSDHPDTAGGMSALAQTLRRQGDPATAETLLRESLAVRERKLPDAWHTFHTRAQLGEVLNEQKKYGEAEQFLLTGFEGMEQRADHVRDRRKVFSETIRNLVQLYEATGQPDKAADWKKKLAQFNDDRE
jgi:tetratricopeptide (TPR) repeat protein